MWLCNIECPVQAVHAAAAQRKLLDQLGYNSSTRILRTIAPPVATCENALVN